MAASIGTRLGPYEILGPLGAGGMGEVYRARDTRLGREVAIKVLPGHLAANADARARFEREAQAISSLNHPNICVLYDVGRAPGPDGSGDTDYLVMELLHGETLAARLARGPLPVPEALRVGEQVADALDRAHRAGIVHRDLKPGNVMLTKGGAKLMDFGLARARGDAPSSGTSGLTQSPTLSQPLTAEGTIVGTFQYMAPEQLEGAESDARTDVWALGCVLHEMVTGKRAFSGGSQASLVSAIMKDEPAPASQLTPLSPLGLDRLIQACLAKSPDDRVQTAHDVKLQLRWIAEGTSSSGAPALARRGRMRWEWIALGIALGLAVAAAALVPPLVMSRSGAEGASPLRAIVPAPANTMFLFFGDNAGPPVISADGTKIAFVAVDEERGARIWIRDVASLTSRVLPGTENATYPFWSPDGRSVGYFTGLKLKRVDIITGQVFTICSTGAGRGGTWNARGEIVYADDFQSDLWMVPAMGGTPRRVTQRDTLHHTTHRWPAFLPDGRRFLYLAANHNDAAGNETAIWIGSTEGGESRRLMPTASDAQFSDGYLFYARDSVLMARPFDPRAGRFRGEAIATPDRVQFDATTWKGNFSLAASRLLVYQPMGGRQGSQIRLVERDGRLIKLVGEAGNHFSVQFLPGARGVVYSSQLLPNSDIFTVDLQTDVTRRLTRGVGDEDMALISPDGRTLTFTSGTRITGQTGGRYGIVTMPIGAGATPRLLHEEVRNTWPLDWMPDGRSLLIASGVIGAGPVGDSMGVIRLDDPRRVHWLPPLAGHFDYAQISHDGRWVAYGTTGADDPQVYLEPLPGPNGLVADGRTRIQVSTRGGSQPRWRADDRELYFVRPDGTAIAVPLAAGTLQPGAEAELFRANVRFPYLAFDATPDGQRFVVSVLASAGAAPIALVSGWKRGLR